MPDNQDSSKDKQNQKPASSKKTEKPEPPKNVNLRESDEGKSKGKQKLND